MAFEFFFGIFGLISSNSKSRHKSRLDDDWRLFTPLAAGLFKGAGQKSPTSVGSPASFKGSSDLQSPIFSTTGTLAAANNSEGVFSSASSSSTSSIASSGSTSTTTSTATLIKTSDSPLEPISGKKYEFNDKRRMSGIGGLKEEAKLTSSGADANANDDSDSTSVSRGERARSIYCRIVCLCLWIHVMRLLSGLIVEKSVLTLDFYYLGSNRIHILIPALCLAIQVAAISLIFIRNNDETNWLVPFYSSKDYLIRSRSNFRPKIEDYTRRVNTSVVMALLLALISSVSMSAYFVHCVMQSEAMRSMLEPSTPGREPSGSLLGDGSGSGSGIGISWRMERIALSILIVYDTFWAIYSTYICFLVAFYFNLICSIMKSRFHGISKIIEDLAESNTNKTTNQARKITTLYLEHNEACELLDESNDFWQYLIFFTYFTYIPAYCYCLYNLFFVDFEAWPSFITWVIHTHTGFIILLISFSAAGVSTEIATFLHRVRGLTIGYSCYDLFAITNGSMSNTAAACASYFLIVADFSRSSVFTMAQMNNSMLAGAGQGSGGGNVAAAGALTTQAPAG